MNYVENLKPGSACGGGGGAVRFPLGPSVVSNGWLLPVLNVLEVNVGPSLPADVENEPVTKVEVRLLAAMTESMVAIRAENAGLREKLEDYPVQQDSLRSLYKATAVLAAENAELRAKVEDYLALQFSLRWLHNENAGYRAENAELRARVAELEGRKTLSYPAWAYESMAAYAAQFTGLDKAAPDPRSEILARAMRTPEG